MEERMQGNVLSGIELSRVWDERFNLILAWFVFCWGKRLVWFWKLRWVSIRLLKRRNFVMKECIEFNLEMRCQNWISKARVRKHRIQFRNAKPELNFEGKKSWSCIEFNFKCEYVWVWFVLWVIEETEGSIEFRDFFLIYMYLIIACVERDPLRNRLRCRFERNWFRGELSLI